MRKSLTQWAAVVVVLSCAGRLHAGEVDAPKIDKYTQMGNLWKVEVSGTMTIDTGETYLGMVAWFLNQDTGKTEAVTWVQITPPKVGTPGSYNYYAWLPAGSWAAVSNMKFKDKNGKDRTATGATGFTLPPP